MDRANCRVEKGTMLNGAAKYFLAKDIKVGKRIAGVRRYIKSGDPPTAEERQRFCKEYALDMEFEALDKAAKLSGSRYATQYLSREEVLAVERISYLYRAFTNTLKRIEAVELKEGS